MSSGGSESATSIGSGPPAATAEGYASLAELGRTRLEMLGRKYHADYVIASPDPPLALERVSPPNPAYVVYRLPIVARRSIAVSVPIRAIHFLRSRPLVTSTPRFDPPHEPGLPQRLAGALRRALPGAAVQSRYQPQASYGRHFGPAPASARPAAVLVLLYPDAGAWHLPLTLRPMYLADHAGQISLPGGAVEPGESSELAAVRELDEELGVDSQLDRAARRAVADLSVPQQLFDHALVGRRPIAARLATESGRSRRVGRVAAGRAAGSQNDRASRSGRNRASPSRCLHCVIKGTSSGAPRP